MPKSSDNLDWKKSPAHFNLLIAFEKPRAIKQVLDWDWPRHTLREKTEIAIKRFLQEGMLVPASIEEGLNRLFQVAHLKKLLSERDLPASGSKVDLIERLVAHDKHGMEAFIGTGVVKCSDVALKLIEERKQRIEEEENLAKQQTFDAFKASNPKEACKIYEAFRRQVFEATYKISIYDVDELKFILTSNPEVLSSLSPQNLKALQLAACMKILWKTEMPEKWLPETFTSPFRNNSIPANYLIRHAKFQRILLNAKQYTKQVKMHFIPGDIDSCDLCLKLDGKIFDINKVPELPIPGCTSETGCMCDINEFYRDDDDNFDEESESDDVILSVNVDDENEMLTENPVGTLRLLKQMLDEGLITQVEYDEKKKEMLSRL